LPKAFYKKFEHSDHVLKEEDLEAMLKDYYILHGWDENGQPA
jgi:aldehyde:ferredoxin oxidoreductase